MCYLKVNAKPGASFGCDLCAAAFLEILVLFIRQVKIRNFYPLLFVTGLSKCQPLFLESVFSRPCCYCLSCCNVSILLTCPQKKKKNKNKKKQVIW